MINYAFIRYGKEIFLSNKDRRETIAEINRLIETSRSDEEIERLIKIKKELRDEQVTRF